MHFERHDRLHKRRKTARPDASYDHEMRKVIGLDLLVINDFALLPLDILETADFEELCVERHHSKATVLTSNRDPSEWLAAMADRCSPSPLSTGSRARPGISSSRASPIASTRSPPSRRTHPTPLHHHGVEGDADIPLVEFPVSRATGPFAGLPGSLRARYFVPRPPAPVSST